MKNILFLFFLVIPFLALNQNVEKNGWLKKVEKYKIQPTVGVQIWSTYTLGEKVFDTKSQTYETVENRFNTQIHRTRLSIKGQPYERLKFKFTGSLDFVGRDVLSGTTGGVNNGSSPGFRIWNAYLQLRLSKNESFNIVAGYLPPQIGRESISAALRVISMEKSWSQNYLRRHLVGIGPGRATGVNFGGFLTQVEKFRLKYDVGVFNPVAQSIGGDSEGAEPTPLFVGRMVADIGDIKTKKYATGNDTGIFENGSGLSLGLSGAYRGKTEFFEKNYAASVDFLIKNKSLRLDGEWSFLWRSGFFGSDIEVIETYGSNVGFLRLSYDYKIENGQKLMPYFIWMKFNGATSLEKQKQAVELNSFSGKDEEISLGINWFLNQDLKITVNYTLRSGNYGEIEPGQDINNLFWQSGAGAIRRGDWVGLGVVGIF